MPSTATLVLNQILSSLHILRDRTARTCAITSLFMTVIAIATAPGISPGFWSWSGLLVIGGATMLAVITFVASRHPLLSPSSRQHRVTAAFTLGVLALLINVLFSFWSAVLLAVGMIFLARQSLRIRPGTFPWLLCATLITLIPWWIWTALDAWNGGLLVLFPLAGLAWLSGNHIREASTQCEGVEYPLSPRGHRLGAWMGMLLAGILVVIAGLLGESSYAWISLGGIVMAVAVAVEAGIPRPDDQPGRYAAAICDGSFVIAALCWLVSIT